MEINFKRYLIYLFRWQLSTPILAVTLVWLAYLGELYAAIIANLIGGLIFFWVDMYIFTSDSLRAQWEVKETILCYDCRKVSRGYRLVKSKNYDKTKDSKPKFRCESCSAKKAEQLKQIGVDV